MDAQIETLKKYLAESSYTVAITGAGISYLYGMRRAKQQVGRANLMQSLTPHHIQKHPDQTYAMLRDSFLDATFEKGPSEAHRLLAKMEEKGMLQGIVTQNLDCLHTLAGSKNVVEFMGSFADNVCLNCGEKIHDVMIWNNGQMPTCPKCGGYVIPTHFARTRGHSEELMTQAQNMIEHADLLIVIGTTGFRSDEYLAKMRPQTKIVQINPSITVFDSLAVLNIKEDATQVLEKIIEDTP